MTSNQSPRVKKIGRFLRKKTITLLTIFLLSLALLHITYQVTIFTQVNLEQYGAKSKLYQGFARLSPCLLNPISDYDECLNKLSVVSKALDNYKGTTPSEALAWGAAQTYLFSIKSEQYQDVYNKLKRWALIEGYIESEVNTPQELREALVKSYFQHKSG